MVYKIELILNTIYEAEVEADSEQEAIEKIIKDQDFDIFSDTDTVYTSVKITDEDGDEEKCVNNIWYENPFEALEELQKEDK